MKYKYERLIRDNEPIMNVGHDLFFMDLKRLGAKGYRVVSTKKFDKVIEYLLMKEYKDKRHP